MMGKITLRGAVEKLNRLKLLKDSINSYLKKTLKDSNQICTYLVYNQITRNQQTTYSTAFCSLQGILKSVNGTERNIKTIEIYTMAKHR